MKLKEAQQIVKNFALQQGWDDTPCIDKFDHIHEELTEISHLIRYKTKEERIKLVNEKKEKLQKEIGDVLFAMLRLANQLNVDAEEGFKHTAEKVKAKFNNHTESQSSDLKREEK